MKRPIFVTSARNERGASCAQEPQAESMRFLTCPFCDVSDERIIESGDYNIVILSNPRLMPGHLLVIPKRHAERLSDLSKEEREELFDLVVKYQDKVLKFASGCDVRQHCRPFQAQSKLKVDHLHVHLQPREFKDELYEKCQAYETDIFKELSNKEAAKMRVKLA